MSLVPIHEARQLALSDELCAAPAGRVVVIGCGNPLRGDDAVGPNLIQRLWNAGVPDGVVLVDGGTAGMDVAFKMRDAEHVVIVDAATTGAEPGTIYRVPGEELEDLPPIDGLHTHQFRWDHALAFGRWLLAEHYPRQVTVYLVEAADTTHGAALSAPVSAVLDELAELVRAHYPEAAPPAEFVEFVDGYVRMNADMAETYFPGDALVAVPEGDELWLVPLVGTHAGGLLLKRRNAHGDRAALVLEALQHCGDVSPSGPRRATWDPAHGALRVELGIPVGP